MMSSPGLPNDNHPDERLLGAEHRQWTAGLFPHKEVWAASYHKFSKLHKFATPRLGREKAWWNTGEKLRGKNFLTLSEAAQYFSMCRTAFWVARKNGAAPRVIKKGATSANYGEHILTTNMRHLCEI